MKRIIALLLLALVGFYVAWPAWSAWRIATALSNEDEALLESKIDFVQVRESLRPALMAEIDKGIEKGAGSLGPMAQVLGASIKQQMTGAVVDQILTATITPRWVIRVAKDGGDLASSIHRAMEQATTQQGSTQPGNSSAGGIAGVLGQAIGKLKKTDTASGATSAEPATASVPAAPQGKRGFGLGNIKGFRIAGPAAFSLDVARDASRSKPDVTVGMAFTGSDWKLTRVVPLL